MKHFSLAEWSDLARNVAAKEKQQAMQAHLDSGCKRCMKILATWTRVQEASRREADYEPPTAVLAAAKNLLGVHGPRKSMTMQLLFDTFRVPALAGVRSAGSGPRQMLYGMGPYRIDLRMEPQMDSDKVQVVGQILNSADPIQSGTQATVKLLRGRKVLVEAHTNALGEFHLECSLEGDLQLLLSLPRSRDVKIPLLVPTGSALSGRLESTDSDSVAGGHPARKQSTRRKD